MLSFSKGNCATLWKAQVVTFPRDCEDFSTAKMSVLREVCHRIHTDPVRKRVYAVMQSGIQNCA